MTERELKSLACELSSLSVFRGILKHKPMMTFLEFLNSDESMPKRIGHFGEFVYSLAEYNYSFSEFLRYAVYSDENLYIVNTAKKIKLPTALRDNAIAELNLFSSLTTLDSKSLFESFGYTRYIPKFENSEVDFKKAYEDRLQNINRYGYGIFSLACMFYVDDKKIVPIVSADTISLDSFVGYESERKKVFDNTKALIDAKPAANVLLFGDAGTGKSSTVKACANHFYDKGVRLIELRKDQLLSLPSVMGKIADNPLKFIIFIDDLSFNKNDDSFSMLKAALEGSASAKAKNAVIYATTNRRHIVKEKFSDRSETDDVHRADTMQEIMSLSDRFGLTVYFGKPNKALYLDIVHKLAQKNKITASQSELDLKAEAFALSKGSRSPRAAEQFVNSLL